MADRQTDRHQDIKKQKKKDRETVRKEEMKEGRQTNRFKMYFLAHLKVFHLHRIFCLVFSLVC